MNERTVHRLDERGTVRDWLVSGSWPEPVDLSGIVQAGGSPWDPDGRWVLTNGPDVTPLKARLHERWPLREQPLSTVVEGGKVSYTGPTSVQHTDTWRRVHTMSDGLVDWSEFCFTPELRIALAATVFEVDQAEWRTLKLASTGPVLLYVGGECVLRTSQVTYMEPAEHEVRVWLASGLTEIVVCSWQIGFRECRHVVRLRVGGLPVRVVVPSPGADERSSEFAEQILDAVGTPRWGVTEPEVEFTGPDGVTLHIGEHTATLDGGRATVPLTAGEQTIRVSVPGSPLFRDFPVMLLPHARSRPVGGPEDWRREVLEHAAQGANGCAAELAATALDAGHVLRPEALERSLWMIENRADCADFEALGLLHLWHRRPDVGDRVRKALLGFKFWIDQPGIDAMCYFTENHQLVWHTAELLAGQAFEHEIFANTGWTGQRHAEHGRTLAEEWLVRRLAGGYSEFDSNAYLAIDVMALTSLVEFAHDARIRDLAEELLTKTLFTLATNSWHGAHVSAHGRSYVQTQRSARLEETASIMWFCWGMGALNHATLPATVLATAERYRLPARVAAAAQVPDEWLAMQRYRGEYRQHHDLLSRPYSSDLVVYKTPDAMLSSVQDYRPGLPGLQEHIWAAALGPETQVYVTHAPNDAVHSSARPNAWAGNRILPRARQHRNVVLAVYRIPADDPMGFTHGWFPLSTMDEWASAGPWLAGRRGDGYVALAAQGGCRVLTAGVNAYQEVRAKGPGRSWVCLVGRRAVDGTFAEFVGALGEPEFADDGVRYRNLGLHWTGPFTVDGRPVRIDG
ncbi:hypothetical protein [Kibdelosporangium aridum]|uniref:hypothetical protein n=1 Tax=Kibdelosporangium aridum TaxID=2030 RepID=UPI0007C56AC9|nr:hypothetical protein [Kibdelosporangium aridum]